MTAQEISTAMTTCGNLWGEMQCMVNHYLAGGQEVPGFGTLNYDSGDIASLIATFASKRSTMVTTLESITPIPGYP